MFIRGTEELPIGPPTAPLVLEIARLAEATWQVGLPDLEPASVVRVR